MRTDPILASRNLPAGTDGYRVPLVIIVTGGLNRIGDQRPYFSLTYDQHRRGHPNQCYSGGAGHDRIREVFGPRFDDLAALHLSDEDGVPMHAEANGWYLLAGTLPDGAGERHHAGNATTYGRPRDPLADFARHCRIGMDEAATIRDAVLTAATARPDPAWGEWETNDAPPDWKAARATWRAIMETMRPRWKAEAEACITRHHLRVFP